MSIIVLFQLHHPQKLLLLALFFQLLPKLYGVSLLRGGFQPRVWFWWVVRQKFWYILCVCVCCRCTMEVAHVAGVSSHSTASIQNWVNALPSERLQLSVGGEALWRADLWWPSPTLLHLHHHQGKQIQQTGAFKFVLDINQFTCGHTMLGFTGTKGLFFGFI